MDQSKVKIVYVISERNGKHYWNRIGIAFVNRDNSINVKLEALPVSGVLQIRDYSPNEDQVQGNLRRNGHQDAEDSEASSSNYI